MPAQGFISFSPASPRVPKREMAFLDWDQTMIYFAVDTGMR